MDFLSNLAKKDEPYKPGDPTNPNHQLHSTKSDLIHSAKVVADVAQAHLRHEPAKYDKAEVTGATADLLDAASQYGKLDEKGIGKYVDKAEDYLRQLNDGSHPDGKPGAHKTAGNTKSTAGGGEGFSKGDFLKK
ncbi:hypothetical protein PHJA_000657300 [Phtheirospermum japonicum]|uniref:Uncharacterized protein n=1 Tax=Phtheirospermum japonicum TaxID=374723 RepID=A0A830BMN8_9LAMI|nr:hypothetical protein PHJA_000657300 [Phtheirospermum japonicum]